MLLFYLLSILSKELIVQARFIYRDFIYLDSTPCEPSKMLRLINSPIHDLVCKKSRIEVRMECPKSDKGCLKNVENATCYLHLPSQVCTIVRTY